MMGNDENIGYYEYMSIFILWIYRKYIDGYFEEKISISVKLIKIYKNTKKTS